MKAIRAWFIIIAIVIGFAPALADYHYASHQGSDEYPYASWETAADSIQKAIDVAEAGDTVYVGAGIWDDAPYNLNDSLALIGMGIDTTILRKEVSENTTMMEMGSYTLIERLTVDGMGQEHVRWGIHTVPFSTNILLRDSKVSGCIHGFGLIFNGEIVNNIFEENSDGLENWFWPCTVYVANNTFAHNDRALSAGYGQWTITNNLFHHNMANEYSHVFDLNPYTPGDSGYAANNIFYENLTVSWITDKVVGLGEGAVFENNVVMGLRDTVMDEGIYGGSYAEYEVVIINNVVSGFENAFSTEFNETNLRLYYNDVWNCTNLYRGYANFDTVVGNIYVDPMFNAWDDFHLQAYSPLIDAGHPDILDIDNTRSDIGCFGGPHGESYPYLDLPPAVPDSLAAYPEQDSIIITWRFNTESDFDRYQLHRDTIQRFEPSIFNMIAEPETSLYVDYDFDIAHDYYYRIAAMDNQGNLSGYSEELAVTFTSVGGFDDRILPKITEIEDNYPNPFNNCTVIGYYLADVGYQPAMVEVNIFDIRGRLVRRLVKERQYPGKHEIIWDGRDDSGNELSSGVYFARLIVEEGELSKPRKVVLLK